MPLDSKAIFLRRCRGHWLRVAVIAILFARAPIGRLPAVSTSSVVSSSLANPPTGVQTIDSAVSRRDADVGIKTNSIVPRRLALMASPSQHLDAVFSNDEVKLQAAHGSFGPSFAEVGRGADLTPISPVAPEVTGNRVDYHRGDVDEWYLNGPTGLEQGFTLNKRVRGDGEETLSLRVSGGAKVLLDADRLGATIVMSDGTSIRYAGLSVRDVAGRALPAKMSLAGDRLLLQVDDAGARYPLTIDPVIQETILTSPDTQTGVGQNFGTSLAVTRNTLVVGAPYRDVNGQTEAGEAYVFVAPPGGWGTGNPILVAELTASDAQTHKSPLVASSVTISGNTIVLGAYYPYGSNSPEAYVYVKPPGGWTTMTETARLQLPNSTTRCAVAIAGDTIVVQCIDTASGQGGGAVFVRPLTGWTGEVSPTAILTDANRSDGLDGDVAINGDTIALAAPFASDGQASPGGGAVAIYEKPAGGWKTTAKPTAMLRPSDPAGGFLGLSLAISGNTVVAGAPLASVQGQPPMNGAAYVFVRNGKHWHSSTETAKLSASFNTVAGFGVPKFGNSVAIRANAIAVGTNVATPPNGAPNGGELFIYKEPASGWSSTLQYDAVAYDANAVNGLYLGSGAAIYGNTFLTGAAGAPDANGLQQGAVYVFGLQ